jgi:hypothetical protein
LKVVPAGDRRNNFASVCSRSSIRCLAQILAVELKQIEGAKHDILVVAAPADHLEDARPFSSRAIASLSIRHERAGRAATAVATRVKRTARSGPGVTFAALLLAIGVGSRIGSGTQSTVTRFMGVIVATMGMQFVLTGLKEFFNFSD